MMGTEFIARHGSMALNNCGFASTEDIDLKYTKAFEFVMDALMLGVGVGFDTKGTGKIVIKEPQAGIYDFQIPDTREGWVCGALRWTAIGPHQRLAMKMEDQTGWFSASCAQTRSMAARSVSSLMGLAR